MNGLVLVTSIVLRVYGACAWLYLVRDINLISIDLNISLEKNYIHSRDLRLVL